MPRVVYVYDALCGWCYGFSAVMQRFYHEHQGTLDFTVLSGGMFVDDLVEPIARSASFTEEAHALIEVQTGVDFGQAYRESILHPGHYQLDSLKPAMAMTLFKTAQTGREVEFAGDLQQALFQKGIDLNINTSYGPLVERYNLNPDAFVKHVSDAAIRDQTLAEFALVTQSGVNGFPSVIVENNAALYLVARGYVTYNVLITNVERALQQ